MGLKIDFILKNQTEKNTFYVVKFLYSNGCGRPSKSWRVLEDIDPVIKEAVKVWFSKQNLNFDGL